MQCWDILSVISHFLHCDDISKCFMAFSALTLNQFIFFSHAWNIIGRCQKKLRRVLTKDFRMSPIPMWINETDKSLFNTYEGQINHFLILTKVKYPEFTCWSLEIHISTIDVHCLVPGDDCCVTSTTSWGHDLRVFDTVLLPFVGFYNDKVTY